MKKALFVCLIVTLLFSTSCSKNPGIQIGYTPGINGVNIPVTLHYGSNSGMFFEYNAATISTLVGTFTIGSDDYICPHHTYIEVINQQSGKKLVFELLKNESKFIATTEGMTTVEVTEKRNSTIVTISSKEITNYLCSQNDNPKLKPGFHRVIIPHWLILNRLNVDWSIHSFGDFIADVFFGILWLMCAFLDLCGVIIDIAIRLIFSIFENLWYFISSIF